MLTPKYQSVLYIDVKVVRDSGWASSAASMGAELDAMVIPRPIKNREAIYMGAADSVSFTSEGCRGRLTVDARGLNDGRKNNNDIADSHGPSSSMMVRYPSGGDCSEYGAERKNSIHNTKKRALGVVEV